MCRILGRLITDMPTQELAFAIQFLETQRTEAFAAGSGLHPKFSVQLHLCKTELLARNVNELPQAMLDSCGYADMGAYD